MEDSLRGCVRKPVVQASLYTSEVTIRLTPRSQRPRVRCSYQSVSRVHQYLAPLDPDSEPLNPPTTRVGMVRVLPYHLL